MVEFNADINVVGALIDDTRALVEVWDPTLDAAANVRLIINENRLGLSSQDRTRVVMIRALRRRFIQPDAGIVEALAVMSGTGGASRDAFRDACFFELIRDNGLVLGLCAEVLVERWAEGRQTISTRDARDWIDKLAADERIKDWAPSVRAAVAGSLLTAGRAAGRLSGPRGAATKQLVGPGISIGGFGYVAYRLHQQGQSSRAILSSPYWAAWLLDDSRVEEMMHRLAATGVVYYAVAGSTLRIDWRVDSLVEVARVSA